MWSATARTEKKTTGVRLAALLLVIFLIVFPKGGLKAGSVPLTWGYILLGLTLPVAAAGVVLRGRTIRRNTLVVVVLLIPFQMMLLYSLIANGVDDTGFALSTILSFVFFPIEFLLVFPLYWHKLGSPVVGNWIRHAIFAVASYGILLFFWHMATGHFIEIPYLTINAADAGNIETTKYIDRGGFFKLIATYNNGNIYGVATIILLPLFDRWEVRGWKKFVVRLALLLTLSRTVWMGLVIDQLLRFGGLALVQMRRTTAAGLKEILRIGAGLFIAIIATILALTLWADASRFTFDSTLGGRAGEIHPLTESTLLPSEPVSSISELVYVSVLNEYGIAGLFGILLIFLSPIFLYTYSRPKSPTSRAAYKGLVLYSLVAAIDGAILFIPVMAFYWFTFMVALQEDKNEEVSVLGIRTNLEYAQ